MSGVGAKRMRRWPFPGSSRDSSSGMLEKAERARGMMRVTCRVEGGGGM